MNDVQLKVQEAKRKVAQVAESSKTFAEFEVLVKKDSSIAALVPARIIRILIQQHAHELD